MTNTHAGFLFNLPLFVAGPQLIQDWLSPPFLSRSRGSLVSSSDAIETPAAVHCCAHVCEGVYVFNSPSLLPFDVSLVCQVTKCTHKHGWYFHWKNTPQISNNYVTLDGSTHTFSYTWTCSDHGNCNYVCMYFTHISRLSVSCSPHRQTKQAEGIVSKSLGVNMDSNTSLRLLLPLTLSETQWSRELHNSLLFTAPCLTYTNINAPFCVSCALVSLSGVAKVITAYCLRLIVEFAGMFLTAGLDGERGSCWSCHQYSNYSSAVFISEGIIMEPILVGFFFCLLK